MIFQVHGVHGGNLSAFASAATDLETSTVFVCTVPRNELRAFADAAARFVTSASVTCAVKPAQVQDLFRVTVPLCLDAAIIETQAGATVQAAVDREPTINSSSTTTPSTAPAVQEAFPVTGPAVQEAVPVSAPATQAAAPVSAAAKVTAVKRPTNAAETPYKRPRNIRDSNVLAEIINQAGRAASPTQHLPQLPAAGAADVAAEARGAVESLLRLPKPNLFSDSDWSSSQESAATARQNYGAGPQIVKPTPYSLNGTPYKLMRHLASSGSGGVIKMTAGTPDFALTSLLNTAILQHESVLVISNNHLVKRHHNGTAEPVHDLRCTVGAVVCDIPHCLSPTSFDELLMMSVPTYWICESLEFLPKEVSATMSTVLQAKDALFHVIACEHPRLPDTGPVVVLDD